MRKIYFLLSFLFVGLASTVFAQNGELKGKITDAKTKEAVPFASVSLELNGSQIAGNKTDFDGNYTIKPIPPGRYDVRVTAIGYSSTLTKAVVISSDRISFLDKGINSTATDLDIVEITDYKVPLIERDNTTTGGTLTGDQIKNLPTRDINTAIATSAGVYLKEAGDDLNIKGSRGSSNEYFIDGIKVRGLTGLPQGGIEQISVITGGVPAQYGDATGGVISITTKGPSKNFNGGAEIVTSEVLDSYGYNLAALNLSGPILRKNSGTDSSKSLLGFFVSGEIESQKDQDPSSLQLYKIKDEVLNDLRLNPKQKNSVNGNALTFDRSEFVRKSDLEEINFNENNKRRDIRFTSRIDFSPSLNTFFRLGGTANFRKSNVLNRNNYLFNSGENAERLDNSYRVFARYTQKFAQGDDSKSFIKNAFYEIQADYSKSTVEQRDPELKDDLFRYGHWAKFKTTQGNLFLPSANPADDSILINGIKYLEQDGFEDLGMTFERGNSNEYVSNYVSQFYNSVRFPLGFNDYQGRGGVSNGFGVGDIYDLYNGIGTQAGYTKLDNDQYRLLVTLNGSIKNHSIQAGFEYEQRIERSFRPNVVNLWGAMRQSVSQSIRDLSNPIISGDSVLYNRTIDFASQTEFDKKLRARLGLTDKDFLDIDSYDPSTFSLDLFTADELIELSRFVDNANEAYRGYDYKGKKSKNKPSFDDFFTDKVNRPIGAFEPVYMAGYIQDKFAFKDIIFNLGLRIDRFDANQKVLKDKYSAFQVKTKSEVNGSQNIQNGGSHPANIGSDYVVYGSNPLLPGTEILGYRNGDQFYDAKGNEITNTIVLSGTDGVAPILSENVQRNLVTKKPELSSSSFKDFKPKTSIMPRISFSFPISDEAAFFANYDVLTQRAQSRVYSSPLAYLRLIDGNQGQILVNPDLKPEKTTDYQVGFKQRLGNTSALTVTAFYRELRDLLQFVRINNVYSGGSSTNYDSFQNQDFGTVKGFTFAYDLRRTNNASLRLSYTLQFANGTGSESNSASNLVGLGLGNIIIPTALDYDQRHNIVASFDYRYGSGANYNGPENLRKVFQSLGANLIFRAGSGTPYSRQTPFDKQAVLVYDARFRNLVGSFNGSRTPFTSNLDLRIDKDFDLLGSSLNQKNKYFLNVYLQIQNLLNTKNIINVYPTTGNPIDDGYLTGTLGQSITPREVDPTSFTELYRIKNADPDNYSAPRISRVGVIFNF